MVVVTGGKRACERGSGPQILKLYCPHLPVEFESQLGFCWDNAKPKVVVPGKCFKKRRSSDQRASNYDRGIGKVVNTAGLCGL